MPPLERSRSAAHLTVLECGELEILGRMPWSSNNTFLVLARHDGTELRAVYKPGRGERPLWDFPDGLYRREYLAYVLSEALGWGLVPETVLRDGPFGDGSVQRFVDADFEQHYFTLFESGGHYHDELRRICVFDLLANNADRKSGHVLIGEGRLWAIDNGLSFHAEPKLRTVIWDFAGEPVPDEARAAAARLALAPPRELVAMLDTEELAAFVERCDWVARLDTFPAPGPHRPYPWPLV